MKSLVDILSKFKQKGIVISLDETKEKLRIKGKVKKLSDADKKELSASKPSLISFFKSQEEATLKLPQCKLKDSQHIPLTPNQKSIWIHDKIEPEKNNYIIPALYKFVIDDFDLQVFKGEMQLLVERNEVLSFVFRYSDDQLFQKVVEVNPFDHIIEVDLTTLANPKEEVRQLVQRSMADLFNIQEKPPWEITVIQLPNDLYYFYLKIHHLIADRVSLDLIINQILAFNAKNEIPTPAEDVIEFSDYAYWINNRTNFKAATEFWKKQFHHFEQNYENKALPIDEKEEGMLTINKQLPKLLNQRIEFYAKEKRINISTIYSLALGLIIGKRNNIDDFVIGIPAAGRSYSQLETVVGDFVNVLPLRFNFNFLMSVEKALEELQKRYYDILEHQIYPLQYILEDINYNGEPLPLFDVILSFLSSEIEESTKEDEIALVKHGAMYGLSCTVLNGKAHTELILEFDKTKYDAFTANRIEKELITVLSQFIDQPLNALKDIELLDQFEKETLLKGYNKITLLPPVENFVLKFRKSVTNYTDEAALVLEKVSLSYKELDEASNQLANYFLQQYAIKKNDRIGIAQERGEWMIVSILAIFKIGGTYVPLDTNLPKEWIDFILKDSNCVFCIDDKEIAHFKPLASNFAKSFDHIKIDNNDLAYIIYTSGSTGKPKGVEITHAALGDYIQSASDYFEMNATDRVIQQASIAFDVSVEEIFTALSVGASLHLLKDGAKDVLKMVQVIENNQITILSTTPLIINELNEYSSQLESLRVLISGGDELKVSYISNLLGNIAIYNTYGPTESTVCATYYKVTSEKDTNIIGKPFNNRAIYIVDEYFNLMPVGTIGEICIAGTGLAKGYVNLPDQTAKVFVDNPFVTNEKVYKTGDLGRILPNGEIQFIGRKDVQVKIRGVRIELGEIEYALSRVDGIKSNVVVVKENKSAEKELIAYFTLKKSLTNDQIKESLNKVLPDYMVPGHYVEVDEIPLTNNGKIDKKNLPTPVGSDRSNEINYVYPKTELEVKVAEIWKEVLDVERIGMLDNFFRLGGNSLTLIRMQSQYYKTFGVTLRVNQLFDNKTPRDHLLLINESNKTIYNHIPKAPPMEMYPLSSAQKRLWVLSKFEEGSGAYNMPSHIILDREINIESFKSSVYSVIDRHEILRTVFKEDENGDPHQWILPVDELKFEINYIDLRPSDNKEQELETNIANDSYKIFDLENGPLLRASLLQLDEEQYVFYFNMHHIISDGWSMNVLFKDVLAFYDAYVNNTVPNLPELRVQYKDYSVWQLAQLEEDSYQLHKAYWLDQFSGELPVLEFPTTKQRPLLKTNNGRSLGTYISKEDSLRLKEYSQAKGGTLFMGLIASLNVLFYRYTSQKEFIIGSPIAGRDHLDLEDQIGFYINTLALRSRVNGDVSFDALFESVKQNTLNAYEHQMYPFDRLVEDLELKRDISRSVLFDVMVTLQNIGERVLDVEIQEEELTTIVDYEEGVSKFDINFTFKEVGDYLSFGISYNTDVYDKEIIEQFIVHYKVILKKLLVSPEQPIQSLDYLSKEERDQLLVQFNDTEVDYPKETSVIDLFRLQAKETPENCALVFENKRFTYKELDDISTQFSNYLKKSYSVKANDRVAIKLDKSDWQIITLLAIQKAKGVYVPIDKTYPEERKAFILEDSDSQFCIDDAMILDFVENQSVFSIEYKPGNDQSENLLYIMYTSGSTGNPKGVMIENKSAVRLVKNTNFYQFTPNDIILSTGVFSFDATTLEYYGSLLNGATLIISQQSTLLDHAQLKKTIDENKVNVMWFTVGWFNQLVESNASVFENLVTVIVGGDRLSPFHIAQVQKQYPELELINGYGPTENTTFSLTYSITDPLDDIPIGSPINNSTAYILDAFGNLVPKGVIGEICLGGDGLALGYLNNPELTREKFTFHQGLNNERIYHSGDLGRRLVDGSIQFIGRKDRQVKIRGHRVESSVVEKVISDFEGVENALVLCQKKSGKKLLIAYLVSQKEWTHAELISQLKDKLPVYMIPSRFGVVKSMPVTTNGKVDRRALLEIPFLLTTLGEGQLPQNQFELEVAELWKEVLEVEFVSMEDDFFFLGGHSLSLSKLMNKYHQFLNAGISYVSLFKASTLNDHCELILNTEDRNYLSIPKATLKAVYEVSSAQKRIWLLSQFEEYATAYNIPMEIRLSEEINVSMFSQAMQQLLTRHDALRSRLFLNEEGELKQEIIDHVNFDTVFTFVDASENLNEVEVFIEQVREKVFKAFIFNEELLLRFYLVKEGGQSYRLFGNIHHAICDGVSMQIIERDLLEFYSALVEKRGLTLDRLPISYVDYAEWQQKSLLEDKLKKQGLYWESIFNTIPEKVNYPMIRKAVVSHSEGKMCFRIDEGVIEKLDAFNQKHESTRFITLVALYKALLFKYTGQNDLVVGTPYSGRTHANLSKLVGVFINTLPIRTTFEADTTFIDLLRSVRNGVLEALENAYYPFEELVESLNIPRDLYRNPLFDTLIAYQDFEQNRKDNVFKRATMCFESIENDTSLFDFSLTFVRDNAAVNGVIEFKIDLFEPHEIEEFIAHFNHMMNEVLENEQCELNTLSIISEEEKEQIRSLSVGKLVKRSGESFNQRWLKTVSEYSESIALKFQHDLITYQGLDTKVNQLINYLNTIEEYKKSPIVGIELDRGISNVVCMVAMLKVGKAYLPLDAKLPVERKVYMQTISECSFTLGNKEWYEFENSSKSVSDEEPTEVKYSTEIPAYLIFTSGSTGVPKGVIISQESLLDYIDTFTNYFEINADDRVIHQASLSFDTHVEEIYPCLLAGGTVLLTKEAGGDIDELRNLVENDCATILSTTPLVINELNKEDSSFTTLRCLISGGDELKASHIDKLIDSQSIYNTYGPSESTVCASFYKVESLETAGQIGNPIENRELFILNEFQEILPKGQVGEIYIGGKGLFMEYVNQPEMTREKVLYSEVSPSKRLYRSGDLGRWKNDAIEFLGRKDEQAKIRGYRVEPAEVESKILAIPTVGEAVVHVYETKNGTKQLVAFYTAQSVLNQDELRNYLFGELVEYMIPYAFIEVDGLPRNINGKIDKKKLDSLADQYQLSEIFFQKAKSNVEEKIVKELAHLFEIDAASISVLQNFFDLGINSLHFVRFKRFLLNEFLIDVAMVKFFEYPTIQAFSNYCEELIGGKGNVKEEQESTDGFKEEQITADEIMNIFE